MDNDKYIGRLLDNRYEILEVIGVGGMAVVYKARCHRLNRLVAVKILKDDYSQDDEFRRRFHAEGQAVAMVSHPNIVSVYDVSTTNDADYIVMELIDGISLKQYMEKKGVLNWKETLHFAIQIGKALEHAHERGIVHRDIKPHNVMVLKNGSVKVADFGIARVMSESHTLTREALGSVHYISPEQAKGGRVDNRSDIYSLGVVMYEMMSGRPPYNGESPVAVAIQHINGGAPMPSTINPNIPGGLEQIIMKAMAHEPSERYDNATAMLYDMDEFRKNPVMLFEYNVPPTDAVIDIKAGAAAGVAAAGAVSRGTGPVNRGTGPENRGTGPVPRTTDPGRRAAGAVGTATGRTAVSGATAYQGQRTTADRVAGEPRRTPAGYRTPGGNPDPNRPRRSTAGAAENAPRRRTPPRPRQEPDEEGRAATVAVIACSAVAVIALIIFLVVLITGGLAGGDRDMVEIPDLLGKDYAQVQADYAYNNNIHIKLNSDMSYSYSDDYEKGQIMAQTPEGGIEQAKGTVVYVTVSLGVEPENVLMDDHIGKTVDEVSGFLDALKLKLSIETVTESSKDVEKGRVLRTVPAAGERLTEGAIVTLYVSGGPEIIEIDMIDLSDRSVDGAKEWLDKQNMELTYTVEEEENLEVLEGTILRTKPAKGEVLKTGDLVIIYVAKGMKTDLMPKISGLTVDEAKTSMAQLITDLSLTLETVEEFDASVQLGKIIRTEPAFNGQIKTGDTIKVYVCAQKTVAMPNVVGKDIEVAKELLSLKGFTKVTVEATKTSDKAKDSVLKQSVAADTVISVDTEIKLTVSAGTKTVKHSVDLLGGSGVGGEGEPVNIRAVVTNTTTNQVVFDQTISTANSVVELNLTGYGVMNYKIEADIFTSTFTVDFDK